MAENSTKNKYSVVFSTATGKPWQGIKPTTRRKHTKKSKKGK